MYGLLPWVKSKIATAIDYAKDKYQAVLPIVKKTKDFFSQGNVKEKIYKYFLQFWEGYSLANNKDLLPSIIESKQTREILVQLLSANMKYVSVVMIYELGVLPVVRMTPILNYGESLLNVAANIYFINGLLNLSISNAAYTSCMYSSYQKDHPNNEHYQTCGDDSKTIVKSSLASNMYFIGNSATFFVASNLPYGRYLFFPARILYEAQTFIEYKLQSTWMCNNHKRDLINKNVSFAMGMGFSCFLDYQLLGLVASSIGLNSFYVNNVIYNVVSLRYLFATLAMKKPLPGQDLAPDIFQPSRELSRAIFKRTAGFVVPRFQSVNSKVDWRDGWQTFAHSAPCQYALKMFGLSDVMSLQQFSERPAIKLYLDTYQPTIDAVLRTIIQLREYSVAKRLPSITPYFPDWLVSVEVKSVLSILLNENFNTTLVWLKAQLSSLQLRVEIVADTASLTDNVMEDYAALAPSPKVEDKFAEVEAVDGDEEEDDENDSDDVMADFAIIDSKGAYQKQHLFSAKQDKVWNDVSDLQAKKLK